MYSNQVPGARTSVRQSVCLSVYQSAYHAPPVAHLSNGAVGRHELKLFVITGGHPAYGRVCWSRQSRSVSHVMPVGSVGQVTPTDSTSIHRHSDAVLLSSILY